VLLSAHKTCKHAPRFTSKSGAFHATFLVLLKNQQISYRTLKHARENKKRISIEISGFHCIIKHASPNLTNILFTKKLQSQAIIPEIVRLGINYGLPVQILENI